MQALVPPQMMLIDAVGAIAILQLEALHHAHVGGVGARPALVREQHRGFVGLGVDVAGTSCMFHAFAIALSNGDAASPAGTRGSPSRPSPTERSRAAEYLARAISARRALDDSRCSTLSRKRITSSMKRLSLVPLVPGLEVERGQAAHRGAVVAEVVLAGRQRDLRAQVRGRDLEPEFAVMDLGIVAVHRVGEHDVGLAGRQPGLDQLLEQRARIDRRRAREPSLGLFSSNARRRRAPLP